MPADEYLDVNRSNWDARASVHAADYGIDRFLADPQALRYHRDVVPSPSGAVHHLFWRR